MDRRGIFKSIFTSVSLTPQIKKAPMATIPSKAFAGNIAEEESTRDNANIMFNDALSGQQKDDGKRSVG